MNYTIGELYNLGFETRLATGETEWYAEPTGKYYIQDGEAEIIKRYKDSDLLRCKKDNSVWLFQYRESEVGNEKV